MKVFISLPMHGRANEEVVKELLSAKDAIEKIFSDQEDLVILHNYATAPKNEFSGRLWFLGAAIQNMDGVDAVYFCPGWEEAHGCRVEHYVCEEYGIQRIEAKGA